MGKHLDYCGDDGSATSDPAALATRTPSSTPPPNVVGVGGCAGMLQGCLDDIGAALASVTDVGVWSLSDAEVTRQLAQAWRVKAGIDELTARLVAAADERRLGYDAGASSTPAWLADTLKMSRGCASALVAQATALASARAETTRRAWAAGDVSTEQARIIATTLNTLSGDLEPDSCRNAETVLIEHAATLTHPQFRVLADHVLDVVDPDAADAKLAAQLHAEEVRALQHTSLRRTRRGDGTSTLHARMSDMHADMLYTTLNALAAPHRNAAATPGPPSGGGHSGVVDIDGAHTDTEIGPLTAAQRAGRALCELIEHLPTDTTVATSGSANATIIVTLDHQTLITGLGEATLDTGTRISATTARRLACTAGILPIVLDGKSRILDHGTTRRLFDRHQRLALTVRDKGCIWPHCDRPPARCQAHHITPWTRGGPTNLDNGCLLCSFHHHLLHKGEWAIRIAPDGVPELIPPIRIDPTQTPQRHQRFTPIKPRAA